MALFFICGRGRSGTWLLNSVLDSHSQITVAPESLFIESLGPKYARVKNWNIKRKTDFYKDLLKDEKITNWWNLDETLLKDRVMSLPEDASFADLCEVPYSLYDKEKKDVRLYGDKNPEYALRIESILGKITEAKFVCLVRDPRDNIASFMNVKFDLEDPIALAYRWKYYNEKLLKAKEKFPSKICIIKFEKLIAEPENTLKEICSFLNVKFEPEMLTFYKNPKNVFSWTKKLTTPFDINATYKWKRNKLFDPKVLRKINVITSELCRKFGYDVIEGALNPLSYPYLSKLKHGLFSLAESVYFKIPYDLKLKLLSIYRSKNDVFDDEMN